jgi:hypothetical protein
MALLVRINWRLERRLIYSDEPRLLGHASVSMTQHSRERRFAIKLPLALPTTVVTLSWVDQARSAIIEVPVDERMPTGSAAFHRLSFGKKSGRPGTRFRIRVDGPMTRQNCDRYSE